MPYIIIAHIREESNHFCIKNGGISKKIPLKAFLSKNTAFFCRLIKKNRKNISGMNDTGNYQFSPVKHEIKGVLQEKNLFSYTE